jgi:multiple sugar transport system permease protein
MLSSGRFSWWHVPLTLLCLAFLMPLVVMAVTALSTEGEAMRATSSLPETLWPHSWRWDNFSRVWRVVPFLRYYLNSLVVAGAVTAGQVFTSACAAYAFSRLQWRGRDRLFLVYLATMMVPHSVTMLPNFIAMKLLPEQLSHLFPSVDWLEMRYAGMGKHAPPVGRLVGLDSYFALIVPTMFSAYGTFLLRQFFLAIPSELDEAAEIDGCNSWGIFSRIIMPLALPGVATLTIFTFMGTWASFLWPLMVTNQEYLRTLPVSLQALQGQHGTEWPLVMAAALLMILPVLGFFLLGQRFFISGLTIGAVKG